MKPSPTRILVLAAFVLGLGACSPRGSESPDASAWVFPPQEILANGLRLRMYPMPGSGLIASNVFVGAGSTREDEASAGSSHFLEHLLFNGTERRTQEQLYAEVDRIGAYNNATTREEYTHFMFVAPQEKLAQALDIQSDMLLHSTLPTDKFEKERGIVIEEISKDRDDLENQVENVLRAEMLGDSAFSRSVIGTPESIAGLSRDAVMNYYRQQYVPSNMLVVLMGDFDPRAAHAAVEAAFNAPAGAAPPAPEFAAPIQSELIVAASPQDGSHLRAFIPVPDDAIEEAMVWAEILGRGDDARLPKALRDDEALGVLEWSAGLVHRTGGTVLQIDAGYSDRIDAARWTDAVQSAVASLAHIEPHEFDAARQRLLANSYSQLEQLHYYAILQGYRIWHGPADAEGQLRQRLPVLHETLRGTTERWLNTLTMKVLVLVPGASPSQSGLNVRPVAKGTKWELEAAHHESVPRSTVDEAPALIAFENGLTLLHTATTATRMFGLHVWVKDRSAREPQGKMGMADLLHRVLAGSASDLHQTGAELKTTDDDRIPYDDYYTSPLYSFVRVQCVDHQWPATTRALLAAMQQPDITDERVEEARTEMLHILERSQESARSVSRAILADLLYENHGLAHEVMGTPETLASITADDVRAFAPGYFAPSELVIGVSGNAPREAVVDLLSQTFATRPAANARSESNQAMQVPDTMFSLEQRTQVGGEQSYLRVGRVTAVKPADRWALDVAVRIASIRMQQDLRETQGLAYSLGLGCRYIGNQAVLTGHMGTRPDNLDRAEAGLLDYFLPGDLTVDQATIERVVNGHLGRIRMRRVTRLGQAFSLSHDLMLGTGLEHRFQEAAGLAAVTPDDVARVAREYLAGGPYALVIAQ